MADCNGWKNKATWNVALWFGNTEDLYKKGVLYANHAKYRGWKPRWKIFCTMHGLKGQKTPDGIGWLSKHVSLRELNAMLDRLA